MKTQTEIDAQIKALKEIRPKVRPHTYFGDDNLAQLDAQIAVLEENMDSDDIYDRYDHSGTNLEILSAAEYAREWIDGESESDDLATDWPLKE